MRLREFANLISGGEKFILENRIFNTACFAGAITLFVGIFINIGIGVNTPTMVFTVVTFLTYALMYYRSRVKHQFHNILFLVITFGIFTVFWFMFDGSRGAMPLAFLFVFVAMVSVIRRKFYTPITIVAVILFSALYVLDYLYPDLSLPYPNQEGLLLGQLFLLIMSIVLTAAIINGFKRVYEDERRSVSQKNSKLKAQQIELIDAKDEAERAGQAKTSFLSTMSHEIRTPLNAVVGLSHLLLESDPRSDQVKNLETLQFSSKNLLQLINNILDFNKIDTGVIEFEDLEFNLFELVNSIRQSLNPQAVEKGLQLKFMYDQNIPDKVYGDPTRLGQVLTNLMGNAIKFTHQGKVQITIQSEGMENGKCKVKFTVCDTGIGIESDRLSKIFDDFTQASSETTRKFGGSGLGLSITKKLLGLMDSEIHVSSEVDKGSEFSFELNFKVREVVESLPVEDLQHVSLESMKVLLVEDNNVNVLIARQFLNNWQVDSEVAVNGLEALQKVSEDDYDIILMDLHMPVMDGYEASTKIREMNGTTGNTPIIALTACSTADTHRRIREIGINDIVTKPFHPKELHTKIVEHTRKKTHAINAPVLN